MNASISRFLLTVIVSLTTAHALAADIPVESVFITLSGQVDVPARETGVLATVFVHEGQMVVEDQPLAQIEDAEAKLVLQRTKLDLEIARKQAANTFNLDYARASVKVAQNELIRAQTSRAAVSGSVSESEIENLQLALQRMTLDVKRSEHELIIADLTRQVKENELAMAEQEIKRRQINSPISGIVVRTYQHRGEWVLAGEKVIRILRLDQLRAEGFISVAEVRPNLIGARATVQLESRDKSITKFMGTLVFVDPEVEPTSGQVRVRAEIDNKRLLLRPGLRASMTIHVSPEGGTPRSAPQNR